MSLEYGRRGRLVLRKTLAKIYVKQQRYDKALEIIKKLNLKYPKKKYLLCRPNQVFGKIDY